MSDLARKFDYETLGPDTRAVVQQKTTEIRDRMGRAAQNIVEIGERLIAVKKKLVHGQFGDWLESEFEWTDRTARQMMAVAERFKSETVSDLGIGAKALYLLASPSTPDEIRDHFIAEAESGKPVTHAAVKQAITFGDVDEDPPTRPANRITDEAREFVADAPLRALDEATSGIDAEPEEPAEEFAECPSLEEMIASGKRFGCIYADPPWQYGNQSTRAATDNHDETMAIEDIAALPVDQLAADDAHLHLWTTNAFIFDCKAIMERWGFTYKSMMLWVKPQMGIGNYWRVSHEILLLGVRGRCPFLNRAQMSWLQCDRSTHSTKPEEFRKRIELVSPGPRLEMFGRRKAHGWTVWGNQIEKGIFDAA